MDSLRKSFDGYKNLVQEEHNMLLKHEEIAAESIDQKGVNVELSGNNGKIWRESSYDFFNDNVGGIGKGNSIPTDQNGSGGFNFQKPKNDDPPSKLIGQFLHKQKASGEICLDMDLEMDELQQDQHLGLIRENSTPKNQQFTSKELRVSFQDPSTHHIEVTQEEVRRRHKDSSDCEENDGNEGVKSSEEVLKCTSNSSFQRKSNLLSTKTKSRLMDPPKEQRKSGRTMKSGKLKSGLVGKIVDEDDEDPFFDEDLPEEFKKDPIGFFTVLQWVSLIVILAAFVCSLSVPYFKRQTVWKLHLWKWVVMVLVLICGRLVSGWVIRIAVFFIERNFLLRKRVLYFVYSVRKAVQNCLWLGLVLIAWSYIFDKKVERETQSKTLPYVTKVLYCLLVSTLIWLVKTLLVKVLASSFHVSTYFDRIQDSLFNQYVIETLSGPPMIEIQHIKEEEEKVMAEVQNLQNAGAKMPADLSTAALPRKSGRVIGTSGLQRSPRASGAVSKQEDKGITIDHLHKLNQKNISAWNMKRLMNIIRHGVLSTLDEQLTDASQEDESALQIRSEHEAKVAAKKIFTNVAKPGSKHIYLIDLMRFMREDEALKTLGLFEGANESKKIGKRALKNWVVNVFRERRALSLTLNDTKTAVNNLHQMVNVVVSIIVVVIWLLIFGIATTHLLVFISSQLLLVVFVFGNTCKMVFESIIFLFVMHPFDVGDRCELEGVQMIVEEMNILTTVFLRYDNLKIVYPNSVLSTKQIGNFYRSPDMGDAIEFCIHVSTPVEKVAIMKEKIKEYIESKKDHWHPNPTIIIKDVVDMNKVPMAVWLTHRMNHQDMGERWLRREHVVQEMIKVFRELDIEYRMLPLEINVRNMPTLSSTRLPSTWAT
ncbi:mechanosensitive ion channel protein 6-like [Tasmannia lanceolata]|uniref:mechanosensitive ion channel protein 6-like n=1 Tax=Tasmannia lanceolata TaxID=3420 RepID=UPI004062EF3E